MKKQLLLSVLLFTCHLVIGQVHFDSLALKKHVSILAADSMLGRGFGSNEMARKYIIQEFEKAGIQPLESSYADTFTIKVQGTIRLNGYNVIGVIPGNDAVLKNEYIVLGAHYDHLGYKIEDNERIIYNGADDNASGTASIIEIGKQLMKNQQKLKRSIILIAFDGEESGLYGSIHFVKNTEINIKDIKLMLSLDMVGMYQAHKGVGLTGIASLKGYEDILEKVLGDIKVKSKGKNIEMQTDTKPFGDEGIPAIHVFTGTESPYHQPEDDSYLLDYDGMAKICKLVYDLTIETANTEILEPTKNLVAEASGKGAFILAGGRLNLGSSHHFYNNQFFKGKSIFATEMGIFTQIRLSQHLKLQPEVLYSFGGSDFLKDKLTMHSVSIPVNLMLTAGDPDGFSPMGYFMIGVYYNYNFTGNVGKKDIDFTNDFNVEEYGISYGVGMQVQHVQVGFYSKYGLTNVAKNNPLGEIFNRSSYFSVGYVF